MKLGHLVPRNQEKDNSKMDTYSIPILGKVPTSATQNPFHDYQDSQTTFSSKYRFTKHLTDAENAVIEVF